MLFFSSFLSNFRRRKKKEKRKVGRYHQSKIIKKGKRDDLRLPSFSPNISLATKIGEGKKKKKGREEEGGGEGS